MTREGPQGAADHEGECPDDARGRAAQVIEQALERARPRHGGPTPRRRGDRDVRKEHKGESERYADHEAPGEGAGGGVRHTESPDGVAAVVIGRVRTKGPSRSRPSTPTIRVGLVRSALFTSCASVTLGEVLSAR